MTYYELVEKCVRNDCMSCPYYNSECRYFKYRLNNLHDEVGLRRIRNYEFISKLNDDIQHDFEIEIHERAIAEAYKALIGAMENKNEIADAVETAIGFLGQALDDHPDMSTFEF